MKSDMQTTTSQVLQVWGQTDVGLKRQANEDSFLFDEDVGIYIVADGMGGHRGGEVASAMAVETLRAFIKETVTGLGDRRVSPRQLLARGYEEASRKIFEKSQASEVNLQGMGTTLVSALVHQGRLYIANVGDSRAYLFQNDKLWQLTEDHSLLNEQLRAGLLPEEDIRKFTARNVITRSVGFEPDVQVDVIEREIQPGEIFLICSDGLSSMISDEKIAEICKTSVPAEIVPVCIEAAKAGGGDDNVTVMVIYAQPQSTDTV